MNDDEAIDVLVKHFLLEEEKPFEAITAAMVQVFETKPYDALGKAAFAAMTEAHRASLQATRATLTAKQPKRKE